MKMFAVIVLENLQLSVEYLNFNRYYLTNIFFRLNLLKFLYVIGIDEV